MALTVRSLLLIGIIFHFIYVASIFDIYFTSPIVHGMEPHETGLDPPATRLVLFVGDGLRADKFFELNPGTTTSRAPYLRSKIENDGSWGVSHTRVPTESRPGHVAIIAGLYEDVSAVTKGWQENPVEFDSVFNASRKTWSFGSPDILPMFAKGAAAGKVVTYMYEAEHEDYAQDATRLDQWVFDKVKELFESSKSDPALDAALREDQVVFFLHLLGLDTHGHSHRPHSSEYLGNIASVDSGIQQIVAMLDEFYHHDGKTAFVFTADHGMNDRGAHGDGDPQNTETPFLAWGAGVAKPEQGISPDTKQGVGDARTAAWNLQHLARKDITQADIAPLMATLLGTRFPKNSAGVLPLEYLAGSLEFKTRSLFANAQQILAQAQMKRQSEIMFRSFSKLSDPIAYGLVNEIQSEIQGGKFQEALQNCHKLIELSLAGLHYLQTYDWLFLRSVVTAGYIGWMIFSITFVLKTYVHWQSQSTLIQNHSAGAFSTPKKPLSLRIFFGALLATSFAYLLLTHAPPFYYCYVGFALFFWEQILEERVFLASFLSSTFKSVSPMTFLFRAVALFTGLELLVAGYFLREILSILLGLLALWPVTLPSSFRAQNPLLIFTWSACCLVNAAFPALPIVKEENIYLVLLGGVLSVGLGLYLFLHRDSSEPGGQQHSPVARYLLLFEIFLVVVSMVLASDTTTKLAAKMGLPLVNQILSWTVFSISMITPFVSAMWGKQHYHDRIAAIFLAFSSPYVLLSISYEILFYFSFALMLVVWIFLEKKLFDITNGGHFDIPRGTQGGAKELRRKMGINDVRTAFFFVTFSCTFSVMQSWNTSNTTFVPSLQLVFINLAFFGTGNVASISSFNVASVTRFLSVFNPFAMGALLLFKHSIPYFLLSAVFGVLARLLDLPPFSLFLLVLSITDVMTLNFFYLVRDSGSWLEIGTSISHFVIASAFIVFLIALFSLSHLLVGRIHTPGGDKTKQR